MGDRTRHAHPSRKGKLHPRHWVGIVLVIGLITAVGVGCGSDSSSSSSESADSSSGGATTGDSSKHVSMAMFLVISANTYGQASVKGVEKAIAEDGNASVNLLNGNFDSATQINQIEDATASGEYNALLIEPIDGTQLVGPITGALDEGLVVICGFTICGPNPTTFSKQLPVTAQIATNYVNVGEAAGKALIKGCEEKGHDPCNVVYLNGISTLPAGVAFKEGLEKVFADAPAVNLVAEAEGQFSAPAANKAMKTVIQAHPEINGVVGVGDQEINGALQAIEESPLKSKEVVLVGDGASELATKGIEAGTWYGSAILRPFHEGYLQAKYAIAAVRNEPLSPDLVNSVEAAGFPEGYISPENVSEWKPEWSG